MELKDLTPDEALKLIDEFKEAHDRGEWRQKNHKFMSSEKDSWFWKGFSVPMLYRIAKGAKPIVKTCSCCNGTGKVEFLVD